MGFEIWNSKVSSILDMECDIRQQCYAVQGLLPTPLTQMDILIPDANDTDSLIILLNSEWTIDVADTEAASKEKSSPEMKATSTGLFC